MTDSHVLYGFPHGRGVGLCDLSHDHASETVLFLDERVDLQATGNPRYLFRSDQAGLHLFDREKQEPTIDWPATPGTPGPQIVLSPDGLTALVSLDASQQSWLVDLQDGTARDTPWCHAMAIANGGHCLAMDSKEVMLVLSFPARTTADVKLGHHARVSLAAFSPDGHTLSTATTDGFIYLWHVETGTELARFTVDGSVIKNQFSSDGRTLSALTLQMLDEVPSSDVLRLYEWSGANSAPRTSEHSVPRDSTVDAK